MGKTEGCAIDWKQGKNLTVKIKRKKSSGKNKPAVTKSEPCESFFNFFSPPCESPDLDSLELSTQEEEALEEKIELDEAMADEMKCYLIPHAIKYYLGENSSDEEDSDEDSSDEDSDEQPVHSSAAAQDAPNHSMTGGGEATADDQPHPECKQQ